MKRQAHATPDLPSRNRKARKIEHLLGLSGDRQLRLLEIGAGSGGISHYFASHPVLRVEVDAVDVKDSRKLRDGYEFRLVEDTRLPFPDGSFDVVISNHVIEHVGERSAQFRHLREISRVLRDDGLAYLAVPNRWMVVEPHYGLPFLSWLPKQLRSRYLSLSGRGRQYDCEPLQWNELHALLERAGLRYEHREADALRSIRAFEPDNRLARLGALLPMRAIQLLTPLLPTFICTLHRGDPDHGRC